MTQNKRTREEVVNFWNEKIKSCKTSQEVKKVFHDFWEDEDVANYNIQFRAKKSGRNVNNFFDHRVGIRRGDNLDVITIESKVEYICDGDAFTRCGQVKYLYRYVGAR